MSTKRPLKYLIREKSLEPSKAGYRTICEVQRQALKLVEMELLEKEPEIAATLISLIEETYDLGKRVDRKMREYKDGYIDEIYEKIAPC